MIQTKEMPDTERLVKKHIIILKLLKQKVKYLVLVVSFYCYIDYS